MRFAVEGCVHGELDQIYDTILECEGHLDQKIDCLLCCGDFQSVRNSDDLNNLACPVKYRRMADFEKYWKGEKKAPVLTIFVGGNHEASNFLLDLYYGGWVCENVFYLGMAGVVDVCSTDGSGEVVRIAGMSGIWNKYHVNTGYHERMAVVRDEKNGRTKVLLTDDTMRSAYHVRHFEAEKMKVYAEVVRKEYERKEKEEAEAAAAASGRGARRGRREGATSTSPPAIADVFLSHDWPRDIWDHGDVNGLIRRKDKTGQMRQQMQDETFGNPIHKEVLKCVQPRFWFAAHHHVKFAALVKHEGRSSATRFLSLDKCLPGRDFLQVLEVTGRKEEAAGEGGEAAAGATSSGKAAPETADVDENHESDEPDSHSLSSVTILPRGLGKSLGAQFVMTSTTGQEAMGKGEQQEPFCAPAMSSGGMNFNGRRSRKKSQQRKVPELRFDPVWLAVQRANHEKVNRSANNRPCPKLDTPEQADIERIRKRMPSTISFDRGNAQNLEYGNLQRKEWAEIMRITDIWDILRQPKKLQFEEEEAAAGAGPGTAGVVEGSRSTSVVPEQNNARPATVAPPPPSRTITDADADGDLDLADLSDEEDETNPALNGDRSGEPPSKILKLNS